MSVLDCVAARRHRVHECVRLYCFRYTCQFTELLRFQGVHPSLLLCCHMAAGLIAVIRCNCYTIPCAAAGLAC